MSRTITKPTQPKPKTASDSWPNLRAALTDRGMSLADLSRTSGVRYDRLSRYACGYEPPPDGVVRAVADALGVDPNTLRPVV